MSANPKFVPAESPDYQLLINGKRTPGATTLDVINPATGKLLTRCARADQAQVDAAVAAAKQAFPGWAATPIETRRKALLKIADALEARTAEFAKLLTRGAGQAAGFCGLRSRSARWR